MFLERLGVFDYAENRYYVPNGVFNTSSSTTGIAMPNCTTYAYMRAMEAADCTKKQLYWIKSSGGFGNAKTWYDTTTLPKGKEIRNGAIAVFNGNCGHVAFVERVISPTRAIITESNYDDSKSRRDGKFWRQREVNLEIGKATLAGIGALIGYIYVPINDKRVPFDTTKHQVEIKETYVNIRKTPNGELTNKGCYCPVGIFDVLETQVDQGYTWYKLDKNCWIREGAWLVDYGRSTEIVNGDFKQLYEDVVTELNTANDTIKMLNIQLTEKDKVIASKDTQLNRIRELVNE